MEADIKKLLGQIDKAEKEIQSKVLVLNTCVTIIAMVIAFCGYITGAFGMNLDNVGGDYDWEDWFQYIFASTLITVFFGSLFLVGFFVKYRYLPPIHISRVATKSFTDAMDGLLRELGGDASVAGNIKQLKPEIAYTAPQVRSQRITLRRSSIRPV